MVGERVDRRLGVCFPCWYYNRDGGEFGLDYGAVLVSGVKLEAEDNVRIHEFMGVIVLLRRYLGEREVGRSTGEAGQGAVDVEGCLCCSRICQLKE